MPIKYKGAAKQCETQTHSNKLRKKKNLKWRDHILLASARENCVQDSQFSQQKLASKKKTHTATSIIRIKIIKYQIHIPFTLRQEREKNQMAEEKKEK